MFSSASSAKVLIPRRGRIEVAKILKAGGGNMIRFEQQRTDKGHTCAWTGSKGSSGGVSFRVWSDVESIESMNGFYHITVSRHFPAKRMLSTEAISVGILISAAALERTSHVLCNTHRGSKIHIWTVWWASFPCGLPHRLRLNTVLSIIDEDLKPRESRFRAGNGTIDASKTVLV